ncbi:hypothetical protein HZI73_23225 [Vallitalea pronyensis]|uniref:Uncharacterized protein n=1 Tax=Vallitalea pronyensis TaxID=1348613 RepID=A0A8J8MP53_9FIRM|nr:hypothetical protein [Vallitalea pronyensis]QUI25024.1 hypothetical protein HZI73_23225 [Vallitalea pronyensis]
MKKLMVFTLCTMLFLTSISTSAATNDKQSDPTFIIVKGEENIRAYEEAGLIRKSPEVVTPKILLKDQNHLISNLLTTNFDASVRGINIPTSTWAIRGDGSRSFSYSMSSYIYSSYIYTDPPTDLISSTGYAIYHKFEPNQDQNLKVYMYKEDGSLYTSDTFYLDDVLSWGVACQQDIGHYFKYKSVDGVRISGDGTVY